MMVGEPPDGNADVPSPRTGGYVGNDILIMDDTPTVGNWFEMSYGVPVVPGPGLTKTDEFYLKKIAVKK